MFAKKEAPEVKEAAFTLLIDASGSMVTGGKIRQAVSAAIMMAEALSKKGVPFEIIAFNSQFFELKKFEEKYSGQKKMQMIGLLGLAQELSAGATNISFALDKSAKHLNEWLKSNNAKGALITFTDGGPSPTAEYAGPEWEFGGIVNKWKDQIPLVGVGIGPGMEATISQYFGKRGLSVPDVSKLPNALLKILESQLKRFKKRGGGEEE